MVKLHVIVLLVLASIVFGQDKGEKFEAELALHANEDQVVNIIKSTVKMKLEMEGRAKTLQFLQQV